MPAVSWQSYAIAPVGSEDISPKLLAAGRALVSLMALVEVFPVRRSTSVPAGRIHASVRKIRGPLHRRSPAQPNGRDGNLLSKSDAHFHGPSALRCRARSPVLEHRSGR